MVTIAKWLRVLALIVLTVAVTGLAVFENDWFQRQFVYPFPLKGSVFKYAEQNNLDPYLIAAVIRTESKFVPQPVRLREPLV